MDDTYRFDDHKLIYHPRTVSRWMADEMIYPIYVELSPTGMCNHRCTFCGLDFMGYQRRSLDADLLCERLEEMGRLGVRSVLFAGEGEPFLHKHLARMIEHAHDSDMDTAVSTNGVLFGEDKALQTLKHLTWIRVSVDAGSPETYAHLHGCKPGDFHRVMDNLRSACLIKREQHLSCTIGVQLVLLPENRKEVGQLAAMVKDVGVDYLVVKPFSQHTQSNTHRYDDVHYGDLDDLQRELDPLCSDGFSAVVRERAIKSWDQGGSSSYKRCQALSFWSYIDAGGTVWGCSVHMTDDRFRYGNIKENTFEQIWTGSRREESMKFVQEQFDVSNCRINCRMDSINRYLWELKNPSEHVNFI